MQTIPYTEIEHAEKSDIGKTALYHLGGNTLALEDTLDDCVCVAQDCTGEQIDRDSIDNHTDLYYLTGDDLVAVEVGPAE